MRFFDNSNRFGVQGRIYYKQGPVQKKNVGPLTWGGSLADPIFRGKNWRPFLVITVSVSAVSSSENATFLVITVAFIHLTRVSPIISGMQKICCSSCGAPFCVGPCSAEHAEHA